MEDTTEKRKLSDRRKRPTPIISKYTFFGGRRKTIRREADKKVHKYVDLYSTRLLIALLSLMLLNCFDAYLTLTLIEKGIALEANPIIAFFFRYGVSSFILAKFLMTGVSLFIFCLLKNVFIVRIAVSILLIFYISLIIYEYHLLYFNS